MDLFAILVYCFGFFNQALGVFFAYSFQLIQEPGSSGQFHASSPLQRKILIETYFWDTIRPIQDLYRLEVQIRIPIILFICAAWMNGSNTKSRCIFSLKEFTLTLEWKTNVRMKLGLLAVCYVSRDLAQPMSMFPSFLRAFAYFLVFANPISFYILVHKHEITKLIENQLLK